MYTIIGGDGQKYGPVSADELRRWIAEGRANSQTLAQGDDGVWKPLASFSELAPSPSQELPSAPPPPIAGTPVLTPGTVTVPAGARTNSMAIAALVLSILGLACCGPIFSTIGLILGIVALNQINRNAPLEGGKGLAIAAIVIAVVGYVLVAIFILSGAWQEIIRSLQ
jgi:hypothetical protein